MTSAPPRPSMMLSEALPVIWSAKLEPRTFSMLRRVSPESGTDWPFTRANSIAEPSAPLLPRTTKTRSVLFS